MADNKENYPKKIISINEQIKRLKERGLVIEDDKEAKEFLKNISYFRLQGYWWDLQDDKVNHTFKETSFTNVLDLYTFDRKLRLLLFDALERIEIALRTKLIYYLSIEIDQWWFEKPDIFFKVEYHADILNEIDKYLLRSKEIFIETHYDKYGRNNRPPAYKTLEVVTFSCLSKLYSNLKNTIPAKKRIATEFDLPNHSYLKSWLQSFTTIRNIIAHHSRLWNRSIDFSPKILHESESPFIERPKFEHSMYHCLSCILFTLNKVSPNHTFKTRLLTLITDSSFINYSEMGFPDNWKSQPIWKAP